MTTSGVRRSFMRPSGMIVGSIVFLTAVVAEFAIPLLPDLVSSLGLPIAYVGWFVGARAIGRLIVDLPAGRLIDSRGVASTLPTASVLVLLGTLCLIGASGSALVLGAGLLIGGGSATANTSGMAHFTASAPIHKRGFAMSVYALGLLGGGSIGPAVAGWVASGLGWEQAMVVGAGLGVVIVALAFMTRKFIYEGVFSPVATNSFERGAGSLTTSSRVSLWMVMFSVSYTVSGLLQTMVPILGSTTLGLSVGAIGGLLGLAGISRMVGTLLAGLAADRWPRKWVLVPGMLLQACGLAVIAVFQTVTGLIVGLVISSVCAVGVVISSTMLGDLSRSDRLGQELGLYRFVGDSGLLIGPLVSTILLSVSMQSLALGIVGLIAVVSAVMVAIFVPETNPRRHGAVF